MNTKSTNKALQSPPDLNASRQARIHRLLFGGAVLGTTLLTFDWFVKLPPYTGE
jgi:hypothetical protein